jgi:hypothetical protein
MWGEDTNIGFSLTTRRCLLYEQQVPNSGLYDIVVERKMWTPSRSYDGSIEK